MMRLHRVAIIVATIVLGGSLARGAGALTPNDPFFSRQWYLERIGAPAAWEETTGNARSIVAIVDVGVDLDHPDLRDAIWTNPDEVAGDGIDNDQNGFVDDVHGWDFIDNDADPSPAYDVPGSDPRDLHHGTVLAGIIAARGGNGEGIAGIDWRARIMPLRILHSDGSGDVWTVLRAFQYAVREGATIINLSFIGEDRSVELDAAIADAAAKGIVVIAAGGNEDRTGRGDLDRFPVYPICAGLDGANVLGVAATDEQDAKATFSSYGRCVDVAAPGDRIIGATFHDPGHAIIRLAGRIAATTFDQPYGGFFAGTSFAAPIAAGAVSLLRDLLPHATPAELITLLRATADPIREDHTTAGRMGAGRVNLARAVTAAASQVAAVPSTATSSVTVSTGIAMLGESATVRVTVKSASGRPVWGKAVELRPERPQDVVEPTQTVSDAQGIATFAFRGGAEGIASFSAFVDGARIGGDRVVFVAAMTAPIGNGSLLRGSSPTVYIISRDPRDEVTKRYAFSDTQTFRSWHADDSQVQRVPDAVLAAFPLGGVMTIRPGTFLVKIQSDPKVYAIEAPGLLRWITTEAVAAQIYGEGWAKRVVDIPVTAFTSYAGFGAPLDGTIPLGDTHTSIYPAGMLLEDASGTRCLTSVASCRTFVSIIAFLKNGYQHRDVIRVPSIPLPFEQVPIGDDAPEGDLTLPVL